jgi:hypothetical protein
MAVFVRLSNWSALRLRHPIADRKMPMAVGQAQMAAQIKALQAIGIVPDVMAKAKEGTQLALYALEGSASLQAIADRLGDKMDPESIFNCPRAISLMQRNMQGMLAICRRLITLRNIKQSTINNPMS